MMEIKSDLCSLHTLFFYAGHRLVVLRDQRYFIFDGFTGFFQLRHQAFRIICCKAKLLCCKGDAGGLDLAHCLDLSFHLGSAVGAVETFYDIDALFIFGDVVKVVIVAVICRYRFVIVTAATIVAVVMMVVIVLVVMVVTAATIVVVLVMVVFMFVVMMVVLMFLMRMVMSAAAAIAVIMVVFMLVLMVLMFVFM